MNSMMMKKECVFMVYKSYYDSPVGRLELVSDGVSLTAVLFENQQDDGTQGRKYVFSDI